jgi:hypothetical protein
MRNSTLLMVGIVAAVAILSARLALLPTTMQQASAQDTDFDFEQDQENRCSGAAECSNEGTITFGSPAMDDFVVSFPLSE